MPGRYAPLEKYLRELPESRKAVTLDFEEIERILDVKLPASAYEDDRWWLHEKEANHVESRSWTKAGWKVERADVGQKRVTFVRLG